MYLVAIKSVYTRIGEGAICIINDGTLTREGVKSLEYHLGTPSIVHIRDIDTGPCPRGGCWERLMYLLHLAEDAYVIQVDSDVLARDDIPEVLECYRQNRSFTLGTWMGRGFVSLNAAASIAKASGGTHIQILAEQAFERLEGANEKFYVRGCAGFAGFRHGSGARHTAETFSTRMKGLIGHRWNEWGSEQVTSNYVVANSENPLVLPMPRYVNFSPQVRSADTVFLHFLGSHRFYRGRYAAESRRLITSLR